MAELRRPVGADIPPGGIRMVVIHAEAITVAGIHMEATTMDLMVTTAEACGSEPGGGVRGGGVPAIRTITRITTLTTRIMPRPP